MSIRAMICDDAMFMRSVIRRSLSAAGIEVVAEAGGGAEAIERYPEAQPDFVTMDLVMPGMTGVEATRGIRSVDPEARVLIISAVGQDRMVADALEAGAADFLTKPFSEADLIAKVRSLVEPAVREVAP